MRPISTEQLRSTPSSSASLWNGVAASKLPAGNGLWLVLTPNQRPGVVAEGALLPGLELRQGHSMDKAVPAPRRIPGHPAMQYTGAQDT